MRGVHGSAVVALLLEFMLSCNPNPQRYLRQHTLFYLCVQSIPSLPWVEMSWFLPLWHTGRMLCASNTEFFITKIPPGGTTFQPGFSVLPRSHTLCPPAGSQAGLPGLCPPSSSAIQVKFQSTHHNQNSTCTGEITNRKTMCQENPLRAVNVLLLQSEASFPKAISWCTKPLD